jgi:hypothetical protein
MKLNCVDARFPGDARHLREWGVDKHADGEKVSAWHSRARRDNAGPRRRRGDLPPRGRENEPDQIRPGGGGQCRMVGIAQPADFDHAPASKKPGQAFLDRN